MNRKPRVFIGSSVESLGIADAVNLNLDHQAEVTIWRNGTFDLSSTTIDSLIKKAKSVDFSLFIFSPDDVATIKGTQKSIARDNVLFELGLFIGSIGKERCFILKPRGVDLHFPTDLLGITLADYEPNRTDGDLASAVNHACALMKIQMDNLKPIAETLSLSKPQKTNLDVGKIKQRDCLVLSELVSTATTNPNGYAMHTIKENLRDNSHLVDLSIIRLEKLGYIEKRNETDYQGYEYFSYTITSEGIELMLANEEDETVAAKVESIDDFDDDIPF